MADRVIVDGREVPAGSADDWSVTDDGSADAGSADGGSVPVGEAAVGAESPAARLSRIEAHSAACDRADVLWLLSEVRHLHGVVSYLSDKDAAVAGRVRGLHEAAGLIRASLNKEVTARFLVGKKESAARAMNAKLLATVANLIEQFAGDAEAGRV